MIQNFKKVISIVQTIIASAVLCCVSCTPAFCRTSFCALGRSAGLTTIILNPIASVAVIPGSQIYQFHEQIYNVFPLLNKNFINNIWNTFKRNIPAISNRDFNYYIKEVGRVAGITQPVKHSFDKGSKNHIETKPKYEWITSHTCRRSFCTNEFLAGTPVELIMKISGHKSLKDFYKYINRIR